MYADPSPFASVAPEPARAPCSRGRLIPPLMFSAGEMVNIDKHATDRVVVVGSGFGVWNGGRHEASARWADILRVRAFTSGAPDSGRVNVGLTLRGGTEILVHDKVPGYQSFLAAAEAALPGMRARAAWLAEVQPPAAPGSEALLFDRSRPKP